MLQEASTQFEEDSGTYLQDLVVGNQFYQTGGHYDDGVLFGSMNGPEYSKKRIKNICSKIHFIFAPFKFLEVQTISKLTLS